MKSLSRVQLFATPWTAAHQAPHWVTSSVGLSAKGKYENFLLKNKEFRMLMAQLESSCKINVWAVCDVQITCLEASPQI